jgi:F0F1-type ATP synthase assembly protein I
MHDPVAAGRRSASRALAIQAIVAALVALAFLVHGPLQAVAAAVGGAAMLLGNALAASLALGGGIQPARAVFARLVFGTLAKWAVVMGVLIFAFGRWHLSPLPTLVGVVASVLAYLVGLNFGRVKRER